MQRTRISTLAGALVVAAAFAAFAPASAAAHPRPVASADSVTGCLRKGSTPNTFTVTTKDGKSVAVASESISLGGHVGHTVTLTGQMSGGGMAGMGDSSKMAGMGDSMKSGTGAGGSVMQVTKLAMVSASCE